MAPGDKLGEDRDGDLLLARGPEVEAGRAADAGERLFVEASLPEVGEDGRSPLCAGDEADVSGFARERGLQRFLVALAHRCDDDGVRPLVELTRDTPADRLRKPAEHARRGAVADHGEERGRQLRLHEHLDRAFRRTDFLDAHEAGLSVGERS